MNSAAAATTMTCAAKAARRSRIAAIKAMMMDIASFSFIENHPAFRRRIIYG
jgi:hypothetical protein